MIYFITCKGGDLVKIGHTARSVETRMAEFQRDCPFDVLLLACVEGNRAVEKRFHTFFFEHHVRDEWFHLAPSLREQIDLIRDGRFDMDQLPEVGVAAWALKRREGIAA